MRRVGMGAAALAVLGLIASMTFASAAGEKRTSLREMLSAAPSSIPLPDDDVDKRLVLVERNLTETFIDNPPEGDSQGDQFVLSSDLFRTNGKRVGHLDAHGVVTLVTEQQFRVLINGTASLPGGEIENQGVGGRDSEFGLTGGTGRYDDVGGELHIVGDKFVFDLQHLEN